MFTVKVSQKNGPEKVIEFSDGEVRLGRVSSNEIVLPKSNISKRHALLTHSSGGLAITDTKSTNGTFVNGERINGVCDLSLGDKVFILCMCSYILMLAAAVPMPYLGGYCYMSNSRTLFVYFVLQTVVF